MQSIQTFVFLDLETTGLPSMELNKTKITELSLIAVTRMHILDTNCGESPRVSNKLVLCFNPGRLISPESTEKTGLCNFLLESTPYFNVDSFNTINAFLGTLKTPICLIAHNGKKFDFPILKNHFKKVAKRLSEDIMCADTLEGFYDILEGANSCVSDVISNKRNKLEIKVDGNGNNKDGTVKGCFIKNSVTQISLEDEAIMGENKDETLKERLLMKSLNEMTPHTQKTVDTIHKPSGAKRRLSFRSRPKTQSYRLESIYERLLGKPARDAHQAESDCKMLIEISIVLGNKFVQWVDGNCSPFAEVKAMTLGVPLGK